MPNENWNRSISRPGYRRCNSMAGRSWGWFLKAFIYLHLSRCLLVCLCVIYFGDVLISSKVKLPQCHFRNLGIIDSNTSCIFFSISAVNAFFVGNIIFRFDSDSEKELWKQFSYVSFAILSLNCIYSSN